MKRILLLMVVVALSIGQSSAQNTTNSKAQFRKSHWGDSMGKVKAVENQRDDRPKDSNLYLFRSTVAGMDCYVAFTFIKNKLTSGRYLTYKHFANNEQYFFDYEKLVKLLKTKYGEPDSVEEIWREGIDKKEYKKMRVVALSSGYVSYYTTWNKPQTTIETTLFSHDNNVYISIDYTSLAHKKLIEAKAIEGL